MQLGQILFKKLDEYKSFQKAEYIIIENQPVLKNPTMKSIQMMLYSYFLKKNICNSILKTIIIISSHVIFFNKLRLKDLQSLDNFNFWNSYKNSKYLLATMAYNLFVDYHTTSLKV